MNIYEYAFVNTSMRLRQPVFTHPDSPSRANALLFASRQLRHEVSALFYKLCVFDFLDVFTQSLLYQMRNSYITLPTKPWDAIRKIRVAGSDVRVWCHCTGIRYGTPQLATVKEWPFAGVLSALQHVQVVYKGRCQNTRKYTLEHYLTRDTEKVVLDTLEVVFGKQGLSVDCVEE
jgi:hypothetical protein